MCDFQASVGLYMVMTMVTDVFSLCISLSAYPLSSLHSHTRMHLDH